MHGEKILAGLSNAGMAGGILPITRLKDIERDVLGLKKEGVIDQRLYDLYMKSWKFSPPEIIPKARSIVIVSTPVPRVRLHFVHEGKDHSLIVPPTYSDSTVIAERARWAMMHALAPMEAKFERMFPALKTVAARTGIAKYGRNNITYVPEHGSFHRLTGFFSDVDLGMDMWQDMKMMDRCEKCRSCMRACPVGAITADRFVVHAERCITFLNELPSEEPFPEGFDPSWHNAIIGCMRCQEACPEDKNVKDWTIEGESFGEEDTSFLLEQNPAGRRVEELGRRLERYGLELTTFPRNLRVLLAR